MLVPGSAMTKQKKTHFFKAPAPLTQHRAASRRSAPPHGDPSPTGRASRHGAGIRPPEGRHVPSAHIRSRLAPVLYRASFVVVVSGQWCTHCDTRSNRRLVAIKTSFARLTNLANSEGHYSTPAKSLNCALCPNSAGEVASCEHGVPPQYLGTYGRLGWLLVLYVLW